MPSKLPSLAESIRLISERGDFLNRPYEGMLLHESRHRVDDRVLPHIDRLYAAGSQMEAFRNFNVFPQPLERVRQLTTGMLHKDFGDIWGFSGYASAIPGKDYRVEAAAMDYLLTHLTHIGRKPHLMVDGGVSTGIPGLSGVLGQKHGIPTLGFIPWKSLVSMGPRTHMVVWGEKYPGQVLVGSFPDILWCAGGKDGSRGECYAALDAGSIVILAIMKEYDRDSLPGSYHTDPRLRDAVKSGQLLVCKSEDEIADCVKTALSASDKTRRYSRSSRKITLHRTIR